MIHVYTKTSNKTYHPSEPISLLHGRSSGSLDDIMLEDDTDLHKELDDFFGPEAEVSRQFLWIKCDGKMINYIVFLKHVLVTGDYIILLVTCYVMDWTASSLSFPPKSMGKDAKVVSMQTQL